jgi:hypothetical protein
MVTDEPDALKAHVRICGSPGRATARGDPASGRVAEWQSGRVALRQESLGKEEGMF